MELINSGNLSRVHNNYFGHHPEQDPGDINQPGIEPGQTQTPWLHLEEPEQGSTDVSHKAATLHPTRQGTFEHNPEPKSHSSELALNNDSGEGNIGGDEGEHQGGHD